MGIPQNIDTKLHYSEVISQIKTRICMKMEVTRANKNTSELKSGVGAPRTTTEKVHKIQVLLCVRKSPRQKINLKERKS
jgi:hypothetical protein